MLFRLVVAVVLFCSFTAYAQEPDVDELARSEFGGLTQKQMSKRIFAKERDMVSKLASVHFVTEAYMQSLGHGQAKGLDLSLGEESDSVIDDSYVLAQVDFGREYGDSPVEKVLLGQYPWKRHYIRKNTGALEHIFPAGFLSMLFVDLYGFDADRYSLAYRGRENLVNAECLVFSVAPLRERDSGRFRGEIWIDSSSYSIVRAKGVFTGPYEHWFRGSGTYFHFDSWRERTGDGRWLPSVTYFSERRTFRPDGNLEFHFRGYSLLWQQHDAAPISPPAAKKDHSDTTSTVDDLSAPPLRIAR